MSNYLDYLNWRGDLSFQAAPLCEVDAMILCELVYINMESLVTSEFEYNEIDAARICKHHVYTANPKNALEKSLYALAEKVLTCPRIADLKICGYVDETDPSEHKQFAAATFQLKKNLHFVCFRGTDETLTGWRENMDLAYHEQTPSQKAAMLYLNQATKVLKGKFIVGGHSKGGNLAVYSTAFSYKRASNKVTDVFNFDGPGFNDRVLSKEEYRDISEKVHTFVPQNSLIGLLLKHKDPYTVVRSSKTSGLSEHQTDTWEVGPKEIQKELSIGGRGRVLNENIQEWIGSMTYEEKENFIRALFSLVDEKTSINDLLSFKKLSAMWKAYTAMDEDQKKSISGAMGNLGDTVAENIREFFRNLFD